MDFRWCSIIFLTLTTFYVIFLPQLFFHLANVFWHKNTFKKDFILIMDFKHLLTLGRDILGINFDLSLHFVVGSAFLNSVKTFFLPKKFFFVCAKYVSFVMNIILLHISYIKILAFSSTESVTKYEHITTVHSWPKTVKC